MSKKDNIIELAKYRHPRLDYIYDINDEIVWVLEVDGLYAYVKNIGDSIYYFHNSRLPIKLFTEDNCIGSYQELVGYDYDL